MPRSLAWLFGIAAAALWAEEVGTPRTTLAVPTPNLAVALPANAGLSAIRTDTFEAFLDGHHGELVCTTEPSTNRVRIIDRFTPDTAGEDRTVELTCRDDGMLTPLEGGIAREGVVTLPIALRLLPTLPRRAGAVFNARGWNNPFATEAEHGDDQNGAPRGSLAVTIRSLGIDSSGAWVYQIESPQGDWRFLVEGSRVVRVDKADGTASLVLRSQSSIATGVRRDAPDDGVHEQPGSQRARK
ncbi:MAG: hypothetical protein AAGB51_14715 [Planctomycetota bacterium]